MTVGKWYHATVLEVRLGQRSLKSRSEGGGGVEGDSRPRLAENLVYVEVTLGTGSSVRLWLDLQVGVLGFRFLFVDEHCNSSLPCGWL